MYKSQEEILKGKPAQPLHQGYNTLSLEAVNSRIYSLESDLSGYQDLYNERLKDLNFYSDAEICKALRPSDLALRKYDLSMRRLAIVDEIGDILSTYTLSMKIANRRIECLKSYKELILKRGGNDE